MAPRNSVLLIVPVAAVYTAGFVRWARTGTVKGPLLLYLVQQKRIPGISHLGHFSRQHFHG